MFEEPMLALDGHFNIEDLSQTLERCLLCKKSSCYFKRTAAHKKPPFSLIEPPRYIPTDLVTLSREEFRVKTTRVFC